MVLAPGGASGKHPFYVVCKCGLGCCVCGGRRVGVGTWGHGLLVMLHVRALFVGGGGCVWVQCPCGRFGPHPGCWVFGWCRCSRRVVWLSAAVVVVHYFALPCCTVCCVLSCAGEFHCVPLPALACCAVLCAMLPLRCALRYLREAWRPRLICVVLHCAAFCRMCVPRRCAEPLNASGRLPRLATLGDQWATICLVVRPGRCLLVDPRLCAPPVATLQVCSTPHVGGNYTAGYTHQRPQCVPGPPAS